MNAPRAGQGRRQSVWLDADVWAEVRRHAARLCAPISALMQHAWTLARAWIGGDALPPAPLWVKGACKLGTSTLHTPAPAPWMRYGRPQPLPAPPAQPAPWPPAKTHKRPTRAPAWSPTRILAWRPAPPSPSRPPR